MFWKRERTFSTGFSGPMSALALAPEPKPFLETTAEQAAKLAPPIPSPSKARRPVLLLNEMEEYTRLCTELGIKTCGSLMEERLIHLFEEENIQVYKRADVIAYLDHKLGSAWEWWGLREVDTKHLGGWIYHTKNARDVRYTTQSYQGAIPLPVLLTVKKIHMAVPEVFFYVSGPKRPVGDPFLLVSNQWITGYIVERWDEPGFRQGTK